MGFPDYSNQLSVERIPDLRTTLFWDPQKDISAGKGSSIEFYTSDVPGEYMGIVRGVTVEGRIVNGVFEFIVE